MATKMCKDLCKLISITTKMCNSGKKQVAKEHVYYDIVWIF